MTTTDVLHNEIERLSPGRQLRLLRQARELRQGDVAYLASEWLKARGRRIKVQAIDVAFLERDWSCGKHRRAAILAALGLTDE